MSAALAVVGSGEDSHEINALKSWLADFRCCGRILSLVVENDARGYACSACGKEWKSVTITPRNKETPDAR